MVVMRTRVVGVADPRPATLPHELHFGKELNREDVGVKEAEDPLPFSLFVFLPESNLRFLEH